MDRRDGNPVFDADRVSQMVLYPELKIYLRLIQRLSVTPFIEAIRNGPLAVVRYFWKVARSFMRATGEAPSTLDWGRTRQLR